MKRLNLQGHGRSVLAAMETIEVVKGPPSPIYGMGKIGGYTNMVPRSVRAANGSYLSSPEGFVQGVSGSFDRSEMSFGVGGPLPLEAKQAGYYVYGLFEDSGSYIERVPIDQGVLQAAISVDDFAGKLRLETGVNLQRSRTAGALIGRFTQDLADTGRYIRGSPLVELDANGNGRIGYLEMYAGSPVLGSVSSGNQALRQFWAWPTHPDGSYVPLEEFASVPGIPQAMYDYLVAHPEADPSGLLRAAGPGGPLPRSGYVPAGFALDPRSVAYDELDLRRAGAFERELEADFVTAYFDLIDDANPDRTFKNQLFFDSMDQYKVSDQPFSQLQDVLVIEDKATLTRRLKRGPGVDVKALFSANVRHVASDGLTATGDYATHRGDAMAPLSTTPVFATALTNPEVLDDGWPWTARYATDSTELGVGALLDIDVDGRDNFIVGARLDRSYVENVDFAGTLNLSAGTAANPAVFRAAEERASAHETGASWSVSWSHRLPRNVRPYVTLADVSVALDENNNKYDNDVILDGHIGRARLAEVGLKGSLLQDRLFFSTSVYEQRRVDADLEEDGTVLDAHATATLTRGWEGELRWGISPEWFVALYALHQETFFRPNAQANIMVDARTLGFQDIVDGAGNVIYPAEAFLYGGRAFLSLPPGMSAYDEKQGNPETQLGFLAEYEFGEGRGVTLSGNYFASAYSGRLRLVELPSAYVLNAGVYWRFRKLQLRYDVLNLLDERYFRARTGDTLGDSLVSAMPGRRWQLTLRASF
jgi:outer membrane receptor protein involved in Fe transport